MKKINFGKRTSVKITAFFLAAVMMFSVISITASAVAYPPQTGYKNLGIRFWEDEKPNIGFYINASEKFLLETIPELAFGTSAGEWSAVDLLRGMYTGSDYINNISSDYFENYIKVFEQEMIDKRGKLHSVKYTEYSRLVLALSSLGYDVHNVAPHYRNGSYSGDVVSQGTPGAVSYSYDIPLIFSVKNSALYKQGINGPIWVLISMNAGNYDFYTKEQIQAGLDGTNTEIAKKISAYQPNQMFLKNPVTKEYTTIEPEAQTISSSNGSISSNGVSTQGKQIEYILSREVTQANGIVGGWNLFGSSPDPDITGMALQALAPYYLSEEKFNKARDNAYYDNDITFAYTYADLQKSVERAIYAMSLQQEKNGGYSSWGTKSCENISQIIVALTMLNIDPKSDHVVLPAIGKTCSFVKEGEECDGVTTNNMIDNLLTFWADGSGSTADIGGFKHVTTGNDGGSGTAVDGMATDQAIYALIAYDRFVKGKNNLYDMSDMSNGEYKTLKSAAYSLTYDMNGKGENQKISFSPYEALTISSVASTNEYIFNGWNTQADGNGIGYVFNEVLSTPEKSITLYAIWSLKSEVKSLLDNVIAKINAIGTVSLDSEAEINEARSAYNALSETLKSQINNYSSLESAEAALSTLKSDKEAIESVVEKINAIGTVSLDSKSKIDEARAAYNALSETLKSQISNYSSLESAEAALSTLKYDKETVESVVEKINAIGTVSLDSKSKIDEARAAYNALSFSQKAMVANYSALENAEFTLTALKRAVCAESNDNIPQTGDIDIIFPLFLMLISASGIALISLKLRKKAK